MVPVPARRARLMATYVQPTAIAATWLALVVLGTGCFFAPRAGEAQPNWNDVLGFGCSMAIASAAVAVTAFAIGGRMRWAIQLASSVFLLSMVVASLLLYLLWYDPMVLRRRLDPWTLQYLQSDALGWAKQLCTYMGPLGATVGIAFGAVAGLLFKLGRKWPRLATGAGAAVMILIASDYGRQTTSDVVKWVGWMLRYHFVPGSMTSDDISIMAMIFGAVVGAAVADLAMYATRGGKDRH